MTIEWIKRELEDSIKAKQDDIEHMRSMISVVDRYAERGWTPDIYKSFLAEVRRVGMRVIHRSALVDLQYVVDWVNRSELESEDYMDEDEGKLTLERLDRAREAIRQAEIGILDC